MSNANFEPLSPHFLFETDEWRTLHAVVASMPRSSAARKTLQDVLNAVQLRAGTQFGLVIWGFDDISGIIAELRRRSEDRYEAATPKHAGIRNADLREIAFRASSRI